jgi:16S rRNA (guanine527-N7)-methyltransferase
MFHVKHEGWLAAARAAGFPLSPEGAERMERYERLLLERGVPMGVIARSDTAHLAERHLLDAVRGVALIPPGARRLLDLGSGGGVPGVPIAIALPETEVVLAEVRRARAAFLELVADTVPVPNVRVHPGRAEALPPGFDVCLARAFAPPTRTWRAAIRLLVPGGRLLYWAGERFDPDRDLPADVDVAIPSGSPLASGGHVVIMTQR